MTNIKKTAKGKKSQKSEKLRLNKETLKDLKADKVAEVKGGAAARMCTGAESGCGGQI